MAEHALAMALAAAKRLILEHENLKLGQFNQFTRNRMLAGGLCGILRLWRHRSRDRPADAQHRHAGARHQPAWPDRWSRWTGSERPSG